MKDTTFLIDKVLQASHYSEVFSRFQFKKQYLGYLKQLHPDICSHPQATEAVSKINFFKGQIEALSKLQDDAGTMSTISEYEIAWQGNLSLLKNLMKTTRNFLVSTIKPLCISESICPKSFFGKVMLCI